MTLELQIGRVKRLGEQIHMVGVEEMRETKAYLFPNTLSLMQKFWGRILLKHLKRQNDFLLLTCHFSILGSVSSSQSKQIK